MVYFIAWVVVGVCCYMLNKNRRDKYLPKYHGGMMVLINEKRTEVTPERVKACSKLVEWVMITMSVIGAPLCVILEAHRTTFGKKKTMGQIAKYKAVCDEFSKIHGIVF